MNKRDQYISQVVSDFARIAHLLEEASYELRRRKLSTYPLFVRCAEATRLGVCLVKAGEHDSLAHYHASSLDELCQVGLVADPSAFKPTYKDPDQYCCLLLVDPDETEFMYLPYPEDE